LSLVLKQAIREKYYTRYLEIQDFLRDILLSILRKNLEIDSTIKFDAIEHIIINSNSIAILRFCSIRVAQQTFYYLFSHLKYRECRLKYVVNSCILSFN